MNNSFEASKFEPEPTFEKTVNKIKFNHLKSIVSAAMNLSALTSFDNKIDPLSMNNSFEAETFEPEPTFENNINEIKDTRLKIIAFSATNPSNITSFDEIFDTLCMKNSFEAEKFEPEPTFDNTINEIKANDLKSITSIDINVSAIT